jgi:hypothetical protein
MPFCMNEAISKCSSTVAASEKINDPALVEKDQTLQSIGRLLN